MGKTTVRTVVAGSVAGLGLAVGGIAIATADDGSTPELSLGTNELWQGEERGFVHHGPFGDEFAAKLAEALGVDEDKVEDALTELRDELAPERLEFEKGELPEPPTEEELDARQDELAAALAEALGVDKAEVETALEEIRAEFEAEAEEHFADLREEMRSSLVERLDEAVSEGTLTEADKESVLKAYDAGVIGMPGLRGGPGHAVFEPSTQS